MSNISATAYPQHVNQADRLGLTLFIALALHAIVILGVSFDLEDLANPEILASMEITLVHNKTEQAPEEADYLAQAHQMGGGNLQDKVRPSSPFSNTLPTPDDGFAPQSAQDFSPPPLKNKELKQELLTVTEGEKKLHSRPQAIPLPEMPDSPTAAQLFERSRKIAQLSAEIDRVKRAYQQTPNHTYLTGANAKEYRFASYLDAWRAKVERIGNLNYPEAALKDGVTGSLLLDVGINPDGSLNSLRVLRSSGFPVLDNAAMRIVKMSAPFPPLPEAIRKETDVLHIPRVWQFRNDRGFQTSAR
ncbi:MAG: energy transducer TonB [Gammaproteobacteria bacterium]